MKLITLLFLLLTGCILTNSQLSLQYASLGLELWFQKMIPSLFPFMILSGVMIRLNLTEKLAMAAYPVVGPLYRVRKNVCYCMILGFLCGFPMGAKVTAELLERDRITHREAEYLLSFCNNIGPVYFCSFVLPLLGRKLTAPYLFGMYGIPLIYGLILRHTAFRDIGVHNIKTGSPAQIRTAELKSCELPEKKTVSGRMLLEAVDESIRSGGISILTLGGYMVLFNLLNLLPHILLGHSLPVLAPLLEITGGLGMLQGALPLYCLLTLSFGGLSCIAQTYSCIRNTGLSLGNYVFHKAVLTLFNGSFYLCWSLLATSSFLR